MAKNKIYKGMTKTAIAAVLASSLVAPSIAQAADHDLYDSAGNKYTVEQIIFDNTLFSDFIFNLHTYKYEVNGLVYGADAINNLLNAGATQETLAQKVTEAGLKGEAIPTQTLKVQSIVAINSVGVEVTFETLAEDKLGASITVVDNTGKTIEVTPIDLSKGQTTATFSFVSPLTEEPTIGVWTVGGVKYDFDAKKQLDVILNAAASNSQVALFNALIAAGIQNVKEANIPAYVTAITTASSAVTSLADVQTTIDKANADALTTEEAAAAVKAVKEAKTEIEMYNVLNQYFVRVNADWSKEYVSGVDGTGSSPNDSKAGFILTSQGVANEYVPTNGSTSTVKQSISDVTTAETIQNVIDAVNTRMVIEGAWDKAWKSVKSEDLLAAEELIKLYIKEDAEGETTKAYYLDSVAQLKAVIAVNNATTDSSFKAALTALDKLETELIAKYPGKVTDVLDLTTVRDNLLTTYRTTLSTTAATDKNQVSDIQKIITTVNSAADTALLENVKNADSADALLAALKAYPGVKQVADTNKNNYWTVSNGNFSSVTNLTTIQTAIDTANIKAIQGQTDSNELLVALKVLELKNIVDANKDAYLVDVKASSTSGSMGHIDTNTVAKMQTALDNVNKTEVGKVQLKAINEATTAQEVKTALDELANVGFIAPYLTVRSVDREFIAAFILNKRPEIGYSDVSAVATEIGTDATTAGKALKAHADALSGINSITLTTTPDKIVIALTALLDEEFNVLSKTQQNEKAEAFQAKLIFKEDGSLQTPFVSLADIKALLK